MKLINICRVFLTSVVLLSCFLMLSSGYLIATEHPINSILTLRQKTITDQFGNKNLTITAKMTMEDGYPLSEKTVFFYETYDFFGNSIVKIGQSITNAAGMATIKYETNILGERTITAKFAGDAAVLPAEVKMTIDITELPLSNPSSSTPVIEKINIWGASLAYGAMVTVLVILVTVFFRVFRGVSKNRNVN